MKYLNIICVASMSFAACSPNANKTETRDADKPTDSALIAKTANPAADTSRCFLLTEGKKNQDSTSIELAIKGNKVTGQLNWLPYQKDSRKGNLSGTAKGDTISAVWSFMQEGMKDTINLKFVLNGNQLLQKPLTADPKTGRDHTDEKGGYTLAYKETGKAKK
jgi:hypothetical protein